MCIRCMLASVLGGRRVKEVYSFLSPLGSGEKTIIPPYIIHWGFTPKVGPQVCLVCVYNLLIR